MRKHAFNKDSKMYLGAIEGSEDGKVLVEFKPGEITKYPAEMIEQRENVKADEVESGSIMGGIMLIIGALIILIGIIGFFNLYQSGYSSNALTEGLRRSQNVTAWASLIGCVIAGLQSIGLGVALKGIAVLKNKVQRCL